MMASCVVEGQKRRREGGEERDKKDKGDRGEDEPKDKRGKGNNIQVQTPASAELACCQTVYCTRHIRQVRYTCISFTFSTLQLHLNCSFEEKVK